MTDARKYLKPAEGRTVHREDTGALWPAEGDFAELTIYVRRRIADRDLVEAEPPAAIEADLPAPSEAVDPPPPLAAPEGAKPPKPSK